MTWFTPAFVAERGGWTIIECHDGGEHHVCRAVDRDVAIAQCVLLNQRRRQPR